MPKLSPSWTVQRSLSPSVSSTPQCSVGSVCRQCVAVPLSRPSRDAVKMLTFYSAVGPRERTRVLMTIFTFVKNIYFKNIYFLRARGVCPLSGDFLPRQTTISGGWDGIFTEPRLRGRPSSQVLCPRQDTAAGFQSKDNPLLGSLLDINHIRNPGLCPSSQ